MRYELRRIKIDKYRRRQNFNATVLATKVLENPQDAEAFIESVLSYEYKKEEYWGKIDGVAIALSTEVYENNFPTTIQWAIKSSQTVIEVSFIYFCLVLCN